MIISHKHKFIFIHCRKVAGSSMKVELSRYLGEDDIVIGSLHEILRKGIQLPKATRRGLYTPRGLSSLLLRVAKGVPLYDAINVSAKYRYCKELSSNPAHPTAAQIKNAFPEEWSSYYKFAFVRNPYEQLVSDYFWRLRSSGQNVSFLAYLQALKSRDESGGLVHPGAVSNFEMVTLDNEIAVDFLGKYENIEKDFSAIGEKLGIESLKLGSHEKRGKKKSNYADYYGEQERKLADQLLLQELETFGYDFPYGG